MKMEIKYDGQFRVVAARNQTRSGYDKRFREPALQGTIPRGYTSYNLMYSFPKVDVPLASALWDDTELEEAQRFWDDGSDLAIGLVGDNIFVLELEVSV